MEQKRVTIGVAKAIGKAGYWGNFHRRCVVEEIVDSERLIIDFDGTLEVKKVPSYCDVWLWLWREKGYRIREEITKITIYNNSEFGLSAQLDNLTNDPEEAIEAAIKYIVDNGLLK